MRLPEFLTELSPVRETLAALEQGENAMAEAVAEKNGQVCVTTATGGDVYKRQGQRSYLESRGTDTSEMKDTDILKANTGSQVFLEAKLTFCDAMEDLALVISM